MKKKTQGTSFPSTSEKRLKVERRNQKANQHFKIIKAQEKCVTKRKI
jgi:hypothetical protein